MMSSSYFIPADVPQTQRKEFENNYRAITHDKNTLFLFAGDQKIEHLNNNFYGASIHPDANRPQHLFEIASRGRIGALATQLGLIARWGLAYPSINYIVKLNSKTNIIPKEAHDPISSLLWSVDDVLTLKHNSKLPIRGIGYTVYLGSAYESQMLNQAAQAVYQAHLNGLVAILWMYPRGKYVVEEQSGNYVTGAAGVAATLGADFAKINPPHASSPEQEAKLLTIAAQAAGNTKLICSGGPRVNQTDLLNRIHNQLHQGHIAGGAIGRNIYQQSLEEAVELTNILGALIIDGKSVQEAIAINRNS